MRYGNDNGRYDYTGTLFLDLFSFHFIFFSTWIDQNTQKNGKSFLFYKLTNQFLYFVFPFGLSTRTTIDVKAAKALDEFNSPL